MSISSTKSFTWFASAGLGDKSKILGFFRGSEGGSMTGMWHTAVVSKLTHLQDSHKRFCFTLCLVRCAWLGFRGGPGEHKAL